MAIFSGRLCTTNQEFLNFNAFNNYSEQDVVKVKI